MKFIFKDGLIWVSIELVYENKPYAINNFIIDTGSGTTAIDIDLVEFNYRKPALVKRLLGIGGGIQEVVSQAVDKLKVGQVELKKIEIEFGDLQEELGINGFIGNDILSRFTLTIDYAKEYLDLK